MGQISHVVPIFLLVPVQCFVMVVTVRVVETRAEAFSKESDPVAPDSLRSNSNLKYPCLLRSRTECFQEST